jgi:hypothetical protein
LSQPIESGGTFLDQISPQARERLGRVMRKRQHDPLKVEQDELDAMSDGERWQWFEDACRRETALKAEADAAAAQQTMEGGLR